MWYGVLTLASIMFGFMFFFKQIYKKNYDEVDYLKSMAVFNVGSGIIGLISLLIINGFKFEYTHFTMIMAVINTINGMTFAYCSLKALGKINLSLFSVLSMLGGMALPFVSGILFHGEPLTVGKTVCFIIITGALFLTVKKGDGKNEWIYYVGVFVCNGMAGVISKIYSAADFEKASSAGYSILNSVLGLIFALAILIFKKPNLKKLNFKSIMGIFGSGIFNRVANWMVLVALTYLPASSQYPFITGGTMVVSTAIALITHQKPTKKEIAAVALSMVAMIALTVLP